MGGAYPPEVRRARLQAIADRNAYHQARNAAAGRSHRQRRLQELHARGVDLLRLPHGDQRRAL